MGSKRPLTFPDHACLDYSCVRLMEVRLLRTQQRLVLGYSEGGSHSSVLVWSCVFVTDALLATADSEGRVQVRQVV